MAFTFTQVAAAGTSAAVGAITGGVSPWFRMRDRSAASSYMVTGPFAGSIQMEYSNNRSFDKGSDFTIDETPITEPSNRGAPLGLCDYMRGRCTDLSSGAPKLSLAAALSADGVAHDIPEDTTKTPAPSSQSS